MSSKINRPVSGCPIDTSDIYAPGQGWIASVLPEHRAEVIEAVNAYPRYLEAVALLRIMSGDAEIDYDDWHARADALLAAHDAENAKENT